MIVMNFERQGNKLEIDENLNVSKMVVFYNNTILKCNSDEFCNKNKFLFISAYSFYVQDVIKYFRYEFMCM